MNQILVDAFQFGVALLTVVGGLLIRVAPPGRLEKIWTGAAALIAGIIFLLVKVKLADDPHLDVSSRPFWVGIACVSLIVSIVSCVAYILSWQKRTAKYQQRPVAIGTVLTPKGTNLRNANPNISDDELLLAAAGTATDAWTKNSVNRSRVILGIEYSLLIACLAFGLNLAVEVHNHPWKQPEKSQEVPPSLKKLTSGLRDVHFDLNRSDIGEDAGEKLTEDATTLGKIFDQFPSAHVTVEGYCDDQGSPDYNLKLGFKRADAVKQKLIRAGVPADKLEVSSLGKDSLLCRDTDEPCRQKNRRVHLAVTE